MSPAPGIFRRIWYRWKMLQLPWRRKWLAGYDLTGNTFYEFRDTLASPSAHSLSNTPLRNRRILKPRKFTHHSDVKIPPQWQQWLRHTRIEPPSLAELQMDVARQEQIKMLAARADERWQSAGGQRIVAGTQGGAERLDHGGTESAPNGPQSPEIEAAQPPPARESMRQDETQQPPAQPTPKPKPKKEPTDSPWKQAQQANPGDQFQPQGWTPAPAKRRG